MDFLSMELLDEGCLVVDDAAFAEGLERRWHEDVARSRQVAGAAERVPRAPAPADARPTAARGEPAAPTFGS
jgi:predicted kinase